MSLQKECCSGSGTTSLAAPFRRSKPTRAAPGVFPPEGPPRALRSLEQAQRVPDASSAKTPVIDRVPAAPGATNSAATPVRGSARTTPPSPSRPTNRFPSRVEVMLSGNARSPGTAIDVGPASAALIRGTHDNSAPANAACVTRDAITRYEFTIDIPAAAPPQPMQTFASQNDP